MTTTMPLAYVLRLRALQTVVIICALFVLLSAGAMLFYPGGTVTDKTTSGYQFFNNFFSELGLTHSYSGEPNTISFALFTAGLAFTGLALIVFFIAFAPFFTRSGLDLFMAWSGSFFGILSGGAFLGIAFTPIDMDPAFHIELVQWAFRTFFIAALLYLPPLFRERRRPRPSPILFLIFAAMLGAYIGLLTFGPAIDTPEGVMIQATGQKIIAYACIVTVFLESLGAIRFIIKSGRA